MMTLDPFHMQDLILWLISPNMRIAILLILGAWCFSKWLLSHMSMIDIEETDLLDAYKDDED